MTSLMQGVSLRCVNICNEYSTEWHDAIYKEGNFKFGQKWYGLNFSEGSTASHEDMKSSIDGLNNDFKKITILIKGLPSMSGKSKAAEDGLHDCYKNISQYVSQTNNPQGSLVEFNRVASSLNSDINAQLQDLDLY